MSSLDKLKNFKESCEHFFLKYTKPFISDMPPEQFNKFRLYFLNILFEDLSEIFDSPLKIHMAINVSQIAFNIWNLMEARPEIKQKLFRFFFMASCFLVIKYDSPEMFKLLKNWTCEHDIDLFFTFWSERLIFNKCSGDLFLENPFEIIDNILKEILNQDEKKIQIYQDMINTWFQFTINEYSIYGKYDIATITMASFFLGVSNINSEEISNEEEKKIKEAFISYLKQINLFSWEKIEKCSTEIKHIFLSVDHQENDEESNDIAFSGLLTRSNSTASSGDIAKAYEQVAKTSDEVKKEIVDINIDIPSCLDDNNVIIVGSVRSDFLGKKRQIDLS